MTLPWFADQLPRYSKLQAWVVRHKLNYPPKMCVSRNRVWRLKYGWYDTREAALKKARSLKRYDALPPVRLVLDSGRIVWVNYYRAKGK